MNRRAKEHGGHETNGPWTEPVDEAHPQRDVAMKSGRRRTLDKSKPLDALIDQVERIKAGIRAKVEHPFGVVKRQFGYAKVRYRGLRKSTGQLMTLFALSNLWMARGKLLATRAWRQWAPRSSQLMREGILPTERAG